MTAQEKSLLYSLLNNADCLFSGRVSSDFAPADFKDDAEITAQVSELTKDAAAEIKKIALDIAQCDGCVLCKTRTNTVPGIGKIPPVVLVIGEGPGADEDRTGEPFVGKAELSVYTTGLLLFL